MKKTLVYGVATAAVLATLGAGFGLTQCAQPAVYGPPPVDESSDSLEAGNPDESANDPSDESDSESASGKDGSDSASDGDDLEDEAITALYGPPPE